MTDWGLTTIRHHSGHLGSRKMDAKWSIKIKMIYEKYKMKMEKWKWKRNIKMKNDENKLIPGKLRTSYARKALAWCLVQPSRTKEIAFNWKSGDKNDELSSRRRTKLKKGGIRSDSVVVEKSFKNKQNLMNCVFI